MVFFSVAESIIIDSVATSAGSVVMDIKQIGVVLDLSDSANGKVVSINSFVEVVAVFLVVVVVEVVVAVEVVVIVVVVVEVIVVVVFVGVVVVVVVVVVEVVVLVVVVGVVNGSVEECSVNGSNVDEDSSLGSVVVLSSEKNLIISFKFNLIESGWLLKVLILLLSFYQVNLNA